MSLGARCMALPAPGLGASQPKASCQHGQQEPRLSPHTIGAVPSLPRPVPSREWCLGWLDTPGLRGCPGPRELAEQPVVARLGRFSATRPLTVHRFVHGRLNGRLVL